MIKRVLFLSGVVLLASSSLLAVTVTVDSMSNIFEAGLGTPGASVGPNLGFFPTLGVSFVAGAGQTISFNSITGSVKYGSGGGDPAVGPDGVAFAGPATAITSSTGISGISMSGRAMFLIGVFLSASAPTPGTQPADITFFTGTGGGYTPDDRPDWFGPTSPTTFEIGQTFVIGDGRLGFGTPLGGIQSWRVPSTATRLFLGFADGGSTGPFTGAFGAFDDNLNVTAGGLTVDINTDGLNPVPEPGTILLMGIGLIGVGFLRKKLT